VKLSFHDGMKRKNMMPLNKKLYECVITWTQR
jgi:hypothetical protein